MSSTEPVRPMLVYLPDERFVDDRPPGWIRRDPPTTSRVRRRARRVIERGLKQPRLTEFERRPVDCHAAAEGVEAPRRP